MKLKKLLITCMCVLTLAASAAMGASAAEPDTAIVPPAAASSAGGSVADPCSDVIETYFRTTADGRLQKRRWNATRGRWVDPYWITIGYELP